MSAKQRTAGQTPPPELFDHLLREGFLSRTRSGFYIASQETRERI